MTQQAWRVLCAIAVALVAIPLIVLCLVMVDKTHFGQLVGPMFLPVTTISILIGAVMLLIATWHLPIRRTWRGAVLFVWALIALTSPLFGLMFLIPWGILVVSLPLVMWIWYREEDRLPDV